jgi:hypothetical protein
VAPGRNVISVMRCNLDRTERNLRNLDRRERNLD